MAYGHDLTVSQLATLLALRKLGTTDLCTLATHLGTAPSSLTRTKRPLVQRGLVKKSIRSRDLRFTLLSLSSDGEDVLTLIFGEPVD